MFIFYLSIFSYVCLSSHIYDNLSITRGRSLGGLNEDYLRAEPVFDESADEFGANSSIQDGVQHGGVLGEVSSKSLTGFIFFSLRNRIIHSTRQSEVFFMSFKISITTEPTKMLGAKAIVTAVE